jgi:pyruvate dehydrogenase E2 component (dihydrolipoamide acetyltransferase)
MTQIPLIMPQLGESIAEAKVVSLMVKIGDQVEADQDVIEVETNKAIMNVTSPCRGRLVRLVAQLNESYPVGATLGFLEVSKADAVRLGLEDRPRAASAATTETDSASAAKEPEDTRRQTVQPTVRA